MEQQENRYSQTIENILQAMSDITNAQAKTLSFDRKSVSGYIEDGIICDIWSADDVINLAVIKLRIPKK